MFAFAFPFSAVASKGKKKKTEDIFYLFTFDNDDFNIIDEKISERLCYAIIPLEDS